MSRFIDRRSNKNKSAVNRQRFLRRYKQQIQDAVQHAVNKRSIRDIDQGEHITIPTRDIKEPKFHQGQGGIREQVFPGNKEFVEGDTIKRPQNQNQSGGGNKASNTGEGEDDFAFEISREEFLDIYFENLELPHLTQKELATIPKHKLVRAGFTTTGVPTNINVVRSMRQATGRRIALTGPYKKRLHEVEQQLATLLQSSTTDNPKVLSLQNEIDVLKRKIVSFPFIDTIDLRFNHRVKQPTPATQAVMICLMDVSGSMDAVKKDIAKRFFILLYLFLTRNYEKIDIVFIRHHTSAKEVNEEEFFYSKETGGTVVSSALELMQHIIQQRYPTNAWNIYAAQASDGDNWNADSPYCQELLMQIMPNVQYFAYIEINPRHHQSLWEAYQMVQKQHQYFAMQTIHHVSDIYPVFCELFTRKNAS